MSDAPAAPLPRTLGLAYGAALAAAVLAFSLLFQGARGIWSPDEGRYVAVALEMLRSGDFVHPRLHPEQPHYTKPPMTYWAIAWSLAAFGRHEWAARLPNSVAWTATVLLLLPLGRRLVPARAYAPALVYATSAGPLVAANVVTTDTILTAFETLAVLGFVGALDPGARHRLRFQLALWAGLGLAFLTKGPPGILPVLPMAAFVLLRRRSSVSALVPFWGPPLFLVLGLGWYARVALDRPALLNRFLLHEVVGRIASPEFHRNPEWYGGLLLYGWVLLLGPLPWTVLLVPRLRAGRESLRKVRDETLFPLLWLALPLVVFVVVRSRLPLYVLPLFVPLAILAGRLVALRPLPRRALVIAALVCAAFVILRAVAGPFGRLRRDDRALSAEIVHMAQAPREIVFVDTPPRYGLAFYLDASIERLAFAEEIGPEGPLETLRSEWSKPLAAQQREEPRLYAVPLAQQARFEGAAEETGRTPERLGAVERVAFYRAPLR